MCLRKDWTWHPVHHGLVDMVVFSWIQWFNDSMISEVFSNQIDPGILHFFCTQMGRPICTTCAEPVATLRHGLPSTRQPRLHALPVPWQHLTAPGSPSVRGTVHWHCPYSPGAKLAATAKANSYRVDMALSSVPFGINSPLVSVTESMYRNLIFILRDFYIFLIALWWVWDLCLPVPLKGWHYAYFLTSLLWGYTRRIFLWHTMNT